MSPGNRQPAGSIVLADAPPAAKDAAAIARLRDAGAVLVGRTNMTEFAYSGLGINPHYGTPRNPYDRINGRIPGGSSSGAAVSVTDGMAAAGHWNGYRRFVAHPGGIVRSDRVQTNRASHPHGGRVAALHKPGFGWTHRADRRLLCADR